ncbi:aminoacylase-1-like [Babylonia areolata]|uniref:aminoacylase-1-like n=1 Tax=Babylonia areolata TaxID=304850 RepID=UPI003FD1BD77
MESKTKCVDDKNEDPAVTNFRTYLRINTVQPNPCYGEADSFYQAQAKEIGLDFRSAEVVQGKPFGILTWKGEDPSLPSVMLYSHTDVVPVFPEHWKYPPFSAHKDEQGNIYARGSQDMKCVGIQYLEAIRRLKKEGVKLKRNVHVVFGPDEEIGAVDGMMRFVHHQEFKDLNVGFAMDEGLASPTEEFRLFNGERSCWWFTVTFPGKPGHGSAFIENTAVAKLNKLMNKALQYRDEQEKRLNSSQTMKLGDVTTLNINILKGGVQHNVVPSEMSATFDVRIAVDEDLVKFEEMIRQWCTEASPDDGYTMEFHQKSNTSDQSPVDSSSPWWVAFDSAVQKLGLTVKKEIFPAGTDGRFVRKLGIPVYGFSPMNNTPILLHDHNEFLNEKVFLRGIQIYQQIIPALANVTAA